MKRTLVIIVLTFLFLTNVSALITIIYNSKIFEEKEIVEESEIHTVLKEQLGLNESQAAEIEDMRTSFKYELENIGMKLNEKQIELINAIKSENPDMYLINNLIDQISLFQASLQKEAITRMINEKSMLNPLQQEKYFSMFDNRFRRGNFMGGRGKGQGERGREGGRGPRWLRDN